MAKMEVDPPPLSGSQPDIASSALPPLNPLKRSNSAPMINVLPVETPVVSSSSSAVITGSSINSSSQQPLPMSTSASSYPHLPSPTFSHTFQRQYERIRRYSTSSTCLHSASTPVKMAPQLDRIKREETSNPKEREAAHEHKVQSQAQLSLSWESLHLADDLNAAGGEPKRPKSFQEPLHIFTSPYPPYAASSPSPTRIGKQCFSPSLQQPVRTLAGSLTPSPSPSPTRKSFVRRSMSPIALRPSPLGASLKRKMESEGDHRMDCYSSPKRLQMTYSPVTATASSFSHPLMQSTSSSGEECQQQNGMLPPSSLQLPDTTPNVLASSSSSFTCRSPLVFASSPAVVSSSSSSPSVASLADLATHHRSHSPQPMDQQQPQHNEAFQNAYHGIFPATATSTAGAAAATTTPMVNHGDFNHHHQQQHQQQQQQHHHQQQHSNCNNHLSRSASPSNHQLHHQSGFSSAVTSDVGPRVVPISSSTPPAAASLFGTFRPVVRDSVDSAMSTGGTDSETSDMAETTDLSETSDANNSLEVGPNPPLFNLPPVTKANVRS